MELKAIITAEDRASNVVNSFDRALGSLAKVGIGAVIAGAAAMTAVVVKSVKAYEEAEIANTMLEHAVLKVTKASKEQLKQTSELADELERKGVLDADNIKIGLAQLSTFGLSNKAVQGLGKSVADLAVNQFGASASGDQLSQSANMIAKALNGQFGILEKSGIRFSDAQKKAIEFGTEMEKVTAINEGFAQNLKYTNETALTTFAGKIQHIKVQFENMQETIGQAVITAITPMIDKLSAWASNPDVQQKVQEIVDKMGKWVTDVAIPWVQTHWPAIKRVVQETYDQIAILVNFIIDNKTVLIDAITAIGIAFVLSNPSINSIALLIGLMSASGAFGWMIENKDIIIGAIAAIGVAFALAFPAVTIVAGAILGIVEGIKWLQGNSKKVTVPISAQQSKAFDNAFDKSFSGGKSGIPGFANGVTNFEGGLAYVHKDEALVNLPRGTSVIPAKQTGMTINNFNNFYNQTDSVAFARELGWQLAK